MKRTLEGELLAWKGRTGRVPILLRGARQVGKSYLVESFGKAHFDQVVVIDFEKRPELAALFTARDPREILTKLEIVPRSVLCIHF